jgi:hypothetical protein
MIMAKAISLITFLVCCVLALNSSPAFAATRQRTIPAPTVERRIHINPPGPNESRYVYVPFEVGPHAVRISISYQYDRAKTANTIDIGLFDERSTGSDTDPRGFRGWSGGRRSEFFVSKNEATPGYLPGLLKAGTWRIILGLYRVEPAGVDVTFKIDIETENGTRTSTRAEVNASPSVVEPTIRKAGGSGPRPLLLERKIDRQDKSWWRGDLHIHTVHSDGDWTIPSLISSARDIGLDFIVITDHNTASHHVEIDRIAKGSNQPLVMLGEEITTYGGHTNAWGLPSGTWIDFRTHPGDSARMSKIVAAVHRAGALISINHPFALCGGCSWSYEAAVRAFDAIEVWNGSWDPTDELALKMWDQILQSGRRMTAIASSDSHRSENPIGQPTTRVAAKMPSEQLLLKAIKQGHVYLTGDAAGPIVTFEAESPKDKRLARSIIGDEIQMRAPRSLRFVIVTQKVAPDAMISLIQNGQLVRSLPAKANNQAQLIEIDCNQNSYFRLEIRDKANTVLALTNPIYVRFVWSRR